MNGKQKKTKMGKMKNSKANRPHKIKLYNNMCPGADKSIVDWYFIVSLQYLYLYKVFDIMFCDSWLHPQLKFLERDASIFVFVDFVKQYSKHMLLFIVDYSITDILTNITCK